MPPASFVTHNTHKHSKMQKIQKYRGTQTATHHMARFDIQMPINLSFDIQWTHGYLLLYSQVISI